MRNMSLRHLTVTVQACNLDASYQAKLHGSCNKIYRKFLKKTLDKYNSIGEVKTNKQTKKQQQYN